ncbi:transposase, partial [Escherichia coli]
MSQHFLLSAQARTLSLRKIFSLSDDQAFEMFKQSRWGHHDAICPCCGS